jgi:mono/diheme cytochrome c family protein
MQHSRLLPLAARSWVVFSLLALAPAAALAADDASDRAAAERFFEESVRPVLAQRCVSCHGAEKQEGGLRLDSHEGLIAGGESGPALIAGNPDESLLLAAVRRDGLEMPPDEPLPADELAALTNWVAGGAIWPETTALLRAPGFSVSEEDRNWWAFRPLQPIAPPQLADDHWSANEIDRFVLARLRETGLTPADQASPETLIRRLSFDMLGLPPTPEDVDAFRADLETNAFDAAWERVVDRYLADPRYGEHQARFWLDLVRYSESDGWNQDAYRPQIWRYRDYVVDAFNADIPYPQFVAEQLAGDELPGDNPNAIVAAGFLRLGIYEYNQRDAAGHWNDIVNEMTDVVGDVFLGLSMACARCHDHKFDPVSRHDYHALRAFLEPVVWRDDVAAATEQERLTHATALAVWEDATAEVRQQISDLVTPYHIRKWRSTVEKFPLDIQACYYKPVAERTSWEDQMAYLVARQFQEESGGPLSGISKEDKEKLAGLEKELATFDNLKPKPLPTAMTVSAFPGTASATRIPGTTATIPPAAPEVLRRGHAAEPTIAAGSKLADGVGRRQALATWIGDAANPLPLRVIVNRMWQWRFVRGLVSTPNDFGSLGQPPSHPELLDWLTAHFIESGFSLKHLHKQLVLSAAWRQSAMHANAEQAQILDPGDDLVWRARVRRLRAEEIRDAMLFTCGQLDATHGGPSVDANVPRRGIYVKSYRNRNDTLLHQFDMANGLERVSVRNTTTTPTQALAMFNGEEVLARARELSDRVQQTSSTPEDAVRQAIRLTWCREPRSDELARAIAFVTVNDDTGTPRLDGERMADFCHVLFNSGEFLYVD